MPLKPTGRLLPSIFFFLACSVHAQDSAELLKRIDTLKANVGNDDQILLNVDPQTQELRGALNFRTPPQEGADPHQVALDFLGKNMPSFFNAPAGRGYQVQGAAGGAAGDTALELRIVKEHSGGGRRDILYLPFVRGVPVEFSQVSVHLTQANEVTAALSNLEGELANLPFSPSISEAQALNVVQTEWAHGVLTGVIGELVFLPKRFEQETKPKSFTAKAHLAWKFKFRWANPFGLWSVYVDAHTGELIGAVNELRSADVPFNAAHWCRDPAGDCFPATTGIQWTTSSVRGALAWERDTTAGTLVSLIDTDGDGDVGHTSASGLFAMLRSTYATVIDELGVNPIFSEGGASWASIAISSTSASPYGLNVSQSQTFTCPGSSIFSSLRFSAFDVGVVAGTDGGAGTQDDIDFVELLAGANGPRAAAYIGANRSAFNVLPSTGSSAILRLRSNSTNGSGSETGYTVSIASCFIQTANIAGDPAEIIFSQSTGAGAAFAANNVFKHLDTIQMYVSSAGSTGDSRFAAALRKPISAHVNFGASLGNAFFDPDLDGLYFGSGGNGNSGRNTALATDVIFHEYTHWAVDQIYNLPNFGHAGAVSEAIADFMALDAFNDRYPFLTKTTFGDWAFPGQSRELNQVSKKIYPDNWTGEIHDDSLILSGALWDLRTALGSYVTRELFKSALFYFPDSFEAFHTAMLAASNDRFAGAHNTSINTAFNAHGIGTWAIASADAQEPNDGFASAATLAGNTTIRPTIFPAGDVDYFRIVAGKGPVNITLVRPFETQSLLYMGYSLQVFDVNRELLGSSIASTLFESPTGNSVTSDQNASVILNLDAPKLLYAVVSAPLGDGGNNDRSHSPSLTYSLNAAFNPPTGAIGASRVSASISNQRRLSLSATNVTGFAVDQSTEAVFDHVDVLDHNRVKLTDASGANLTMISSMSVAGRVEAVLDLPSNFFNRYPGVGSLYLDLYVRNGLGKTYSVGISNEVKIFSAITELKAYNNIFNPMKGESAILKYQSTSSGRHRLAVYTIAGDLVRVLVDRDEIGGSGSISWDGRNGAGVMVASGVYLVHLESPSGYKDQKVIVIK